VGPGGVHENTSCSVFTVFAVLDDFEMHSSPSPPSVSHPRAGQRFFRKVAPPRRPRRASSAYPLALYEEQKIRLTQRHHISTCLCDAPQTPPSAYELLASGYPNWKCSG